MKKIILFSLLAICSVVAKAQDSYADAVKAYMDKNFENSGVDMSSIPADMQDDMYECIVEAFRENNITVDDLNEASAIYETEEAKAIAAKAALMQGQEAQAKLQQVLTQSMMPILMGGEPQPVKTPDVSESYKQKFHEYYETTGAKSTIDGAFAALETVLKNQPEAEGLLTKMRTFFAEQGENMTLVIAEGMYTEDELVTVTNFSKKPVIQRIMKASASITPKFLERMMKKQNLGF